MHASLSPCTRVACLLSHFKNTQSLSFLLISLACFVKHNRTGQGNIRVGWGFYGHWSLVGLLWAPTALGWRPFVSDYFFYRFICVVHVCLILHLRLLCMGMVLDCVRIYIYMHLYEMDFMELQSFPFGNVDVLQMFMVCLSKGWEVINLWVGSKKHRTQA